jgi:hypothetical protein
LPTRADQSRDPVHHGGPSKQVDRHDLSVATYLLGFIAGLAPEMYGKMYGRKRSTHAYQANFRSAQGDSAEASSPCI